MMSFDESQARPFIKLLHGDEEANVCWQVFHDSQTSADTYNNPVTFHARLQDAIDFFKGVKPYNYGIYCTLNRTDGNGRALENIRGYSFVFADFDNTVIGDLPLEPHLITQRDATHSHCYWRVSGMVTDDIFKRCQKRAAVYLGTDRQVFDPSRVVRVAGSYNCKNHLNPMMYNIVKIEADKPAYTVDEFETGFKLSGEKLIDFDQWCETKSALMEGDEYNDLPIYRERFKTWLKFQADPAVKGNGRSYGVLRAAAMGKDLGIPLAEAQQMMWEHYNDRIQPPYSEQERISKLYKYTERGYRYGNNAVGCRTAAASFLRECGEVPEPTGGWEHNKSLKQPVKKVEPAVAFDTTKVADKTDDKAMISKAQGAVMLAQTNSKTSTWSLAKTFIANEYPDGALIYNDATYYGYVGTHWIEVEEDTLVSDVSWFYSQFEFEPSKINNIVKQIRSFVHYTNLERNTWLDGSHNDDNTLSFRNVLLDLTDEPTVIPHNRNYFSHNTLGYDYDPQAECKEWLKFLDSLDWTDSLIGLLQEAMGYLLTVDCTPQKIILLLGRSRAGKSVITTVCSKLVGECNTSSPSFESLIKDSTKHELSKKLLALIPEITQPHPSKSQELLGVTKAMSGNDAITFDRKFKGMQTNSRWCKIVGTANTMPTFDDPSGALANRFLIFPFTKSFRGVEDYGLEVRLDKEIAGIMNWAIAGLKRLQANGMRFSDVQEVTDLVNDTRRDMFPLADFVDDCCIVDDNALITNAELYTAYRYYVKERDSKYVMSDVKFGKTLKSSYLNIHPYRYPADEHGKRPRGIKGLKLNDMMKQNINPAGKISNVVTMPAVQLTK